MGSTAHLLVAGGCELLVRARSRLEELESLWSRFRADSELCRLNASPGQWVKLSAPTLALVRRAVRAWEVTGGLADPTVLPAPLHLRLPAPRRWPGACSPSTSWPPSR